MKRAAVLVALAACSALAVPPRSYSCYRLPAAPVMDGQLEDAAWKAAPEGTGFYLLKKPGSYALEKQTFFRMGWRPDSLYLAIRCVEPQLAAVKADADAIWNGDCLELFFVPDALSDGYYQMAANRAQARWNAVGPSPFKRSKELWDWQVCAGEWDGGWQLEIRIPFTTLADTPTDGETWRMNLCRNLLTGPASERFTCLAPTVGVFNDTDSFAWLKFQDQTPDAEAVAAENHRKSAPFRAWLRRHFAQLEAEQRNSTELHAALADPRLAAESEALRSATAELAGVGEDTTLGVGKMMALLDAHRRRTAAFTEKAGELGISLEPALPLTARIDVRDAQDVILYVNGEQITQREGAWKTALREGVNVIGIKTAATGNAPALRVRVPDRPELQRRWRVSGSDEGWLTAAFDDRSWRVAIHDKDGFLSSPDAGTHTLCFRQIVLWAPNHYTGLPCIQPKVREWKFSQSSMETIFHPLYTPPPLAFGLSDYAFVLDLPEGFRLLDYGKGAPLGGGSLNRSPGAVTQEKVKHDGEAYTRYRCGFTEDAVQPPDAKLGQTAQIHVVSNDARQPGETCRFYFRRLASGNLTELEQELPVRILPPINGRVPRQIAIQTYNSTPWHYIKAREEIHAEHLDLLTRQSIVAGISRWILSPRHGVAGVVAGRVHALGSTVAIWGNVNFPLTIYRGSDPDSELVRWVLSTKEAQARIFNDTPLGSWHNPGSRVQYCPSFVTSAAQARFRELVKTDIRRMLKGDGKTYGGLPMADVYWADFEQTPWLQAGMGYRPPTTGDGSYCFCDRCKEVFRKCAKLPADADLSDDAIFREHTEVWTAFRRELDGRVVGIVNDVCDELGLQHMFYAGLNHRELWKACKGRLDLFFPGYPGSGQAIGNGPEGGIKGFAVPQKVLDSIMGFFRNQAGAPRVIGQLFAGNYNPKSWQGWSQPAISSTDGFNHPIRLKSQVLRVVAAFHGGIDLNNAIERCSGQLYYIGEATRLISDHEGLFLNGKRADNLGKSEQIAAPNLLVLTNAGERLVLAFNETDQPLTAEVRSKGLKPGQTATIYYAAATDTTPDTVTVTIPPADVEAVHIK